MRFRIAHSTTENFAARSTRSQGLPLPIPFQPTNGGARVRRLATTVLSTLVLAACGGGSDGGDSHADNTATATTPSSPSVQAPTRAPDSLAADEVAVEATPADATPTPPLVLAPTPEPAPNPNPVPAPVPSPIPVPSPVPAPTLPPVTASWASPPIDTVIPLPNVAAATTGAFGPLASWPIIPVHASLLPDGRVMTFGTRPNGTQTAMFEYDVWNSLEGLGAESHLTLPNTTTVDLFCSSQLVLPMSGDVIFNGGDIYSATIGKSTNVGNADATLFRAATNTLERAGTMQRPRWYSSAITLPNGETYIQGGKGGGDRAEIRGLDGSFRLLTGFRTNDLSTSYPRIFTAPDGKVFGFAYQTMFSIDPAGNGTRRDLGKITGAAPLWQTPVVMFSPGQILIAGGADKRAAVIDIRGATPTITSAGELSARRIWSNATVLADGTVAVTGGSNQDRDLRSAFYHMELFDPATRTWTSGPSAQRSRLYHSISMLLPDATMLTGGGGAPGPETNTNVEIYYPPYLFGVDGQPKARPVISGAPTVAEPASAFWVRSPDAARITRLTLVATGSVTHTFDRNQRFMELSFYRDGEGLRAQLPVNRFDTPPGYYMLFAFDDAGTPSMARMIRINPV